MTYVHQREIGPASRLSYINSQLLLVIADRNGLRNNSQAIKDLRLELWIGRGKNYEHNLTYPINNILTLKYSLSLGVS